MVGRNWCFKLSDSQYEKLKTAHDEIVAERGSTYCGAIGGSVKFEIIPTSIGEFVTAWCYGKEIDLSEV